MPYLASAIQRPRPDQRRGIIETILIFEGKPVELNAHLERLAASARAVYGKNPPSVRDLIMQRARGVSLGRMRVTLAPLGGHLNPMVVVAPLDPRLVFPINNFASTLRILPVDRGYGEHKWADRELLGRAETAAGSGAVPLLVDGNGAVLEASRANVFLIRDRKVMTPPLDDSILPGVARATVIEIATEFGVEVREEALRLGALREADEVFLTGSLRGIEPVRALEEESLPGEGPLARELAAGLRERWFGRWT